jgi:hypothetical protein
MCLQVVGNVRSLWFVRLGEQKSGKCGLGYRPMSLGAVGPALGPQGSVPAMSRVNLVEKFAGRRL